MCNSSIIQRIKIFNHNPPRDPELLQLKYAKMKENAFAFLRGSCHLFYEDWPANSSLNQAPLSWICGDLHLENFGSYQEDNRLTYFDINDFDESVLAPCTLDITRLITSLFLAVAQIESFSPDPLTLAKLFLDTYTSALSDGKARWIERDTATGLVEQLLNKAQENNRTQFLDKKAPVGQDGIRKIKIKEDKTRKVSDETSNTVKAAVKKFAQSQKNPEFFDVIDVAWRIAGTGSLGLERYLVLVEGNGSSDDNYLLDLKLAIEPSLVRFLKDFPQLKWKNESQRIISNQQKIQAIAPALLNSLMIDEKFFVMREYQPSDDKIDLTSPDLNLDQQSLKQLIEDLGKVIAWSQLRSSGRQGSANADALINFAQDTHWHQSVLNYAQNYSQAVKANYKEFKEHLGQDS
jgi:uncharacterized protein (DUF2252 family)